MKFLLILIAKTKISLLLLRAMRVSMPTSVSASGHAHAHLHLYVCVCASMCVRLCVCAERASAPSFGHSDADKCCTRIPNTFLSLAAAAVARANVNAATAATARSCCTVPHVVGPLREREERERGSSEYLWLVIHAFSLSLPEAEDTCCAICLSSEKEL